MRRCAVFPEEDPGRVAERAFHDWSRLVDPLPPHAESCRASDEEWEVSAISPEDVNLVRWARYAEAEADARVAARLESFGDAPLSWFVGPLSEPLDLHERLARAGLGPAGDHGLMLRPFADLPETSPPAGVDISPVRNEALLDEYIRVFSHVFTPDPTRDLARRGRLLELGLDEGAPVRSFVASLDGRVVGCASVALCETAAVIFAVAVLPDARRRGIARSLTTHTVRAAREAGRDHAVLVAVGDAPALYRALGFVDVGRLRVLERT